MSDKVSFERASQRAQGWLNTVHLITQPYEGEGIRIAYQLLSYLQGELDKHSSAIEDEIGRLAVVSDGPVKWSKERGARGVLGDGGVVSVWSSAHEASLGIATLALDFLLSPVQAISDEKEQQEAAEHYFSTRRKALAISDDEVAELQERIRRERAKLLHGLNPKLEKHERELRNGEKVEPEDVPAIFREDGKPEGEILTSTYLIENPNWYFSYPKQFTDAVKAGKLTRYIKVGRPSAYLYSELLVMNLRDAKE